MEWYKHNLFIYLDAYYFNLYLKSYKTWKHLPPKDYFEFSNSLTHPHINYQWIILSTIKHSMWNILIPPTKKK
jgi:hypothetical protein